MYFLRWDFVLWMLIPLLNFVSSYLLDFRVEWLTFRWYAKSAVRPRFSARKGLQGQCKDSKNLDPIMLNLLLVCSYCSGNWINVEVIF
jgi:hypothetical protein